MIEDAAESPADHAGGGDRVTPMMAQYLAIRKAHPDCLLFYRMGDFYELFFDDAAIASRHLGIALTRRGKHLGQDIPMCGVPVHAADDYLMKLIGKGLRVAICEQTEDPAEARRRGAKSVVSRAVVRVVTPGTLTEDKLLDARRAHHLAALLPPADAAGAWAIAWLDLSTGAFRIGVSAGAGSTTSGPAALLAAIEPRELLVPERSAADPATRALAADAGAALTPLPASFFDTATGGPRLCALFGVASLDAYGPFTAPEIAAGAALVAYVGKTQLAARPAIAPPLRVCESDAMRIDPATRANLELVRTIGGGRDGSLLAAIDRTCTGAGSRLLAERLAHPLRDPAAIAARLDAVAFFAEAGELREGVRAALDAAPDTLRALTRLSLGRGGPRDLDTVRAGLRAAQAVAALLDGAGPERIAQARTALSHLPAPLVDRLEAALAEALPRDVAEGGFVRPGFDPALDEARALRDDTRRVIATLQSRYAETTGVRSLKVRHNNVLGYYVEVPAAQAPLLTGLAEGGATFVHRQTMAGAMRFATVELAELERRIAGAAEQALALERATFEALATAILDAQDDVRDAAQACAELDVAAALAELAVRERYIRPRVDGSLAFTIQGGRHTVVEQALVRRGESFVGNDCALGPAGTADGGRGRISLLTGPNMAGKSTYLRQNALIAILAQTGSFVPATAAHIGVVDAVFSRVGAADDLARGRSTFMVEMVETAAILNQATERSLVILDEIGRGTATFDGLSIAWAAVEHLHDAIGCRALFATHYHELTALSARLPRLANATMAVREWKGDVVFLHEVAPGAADRSYGIQVAKLAGLPASVVARARQVLGSLERGDRSRPRLSVDDLPLFAAAPTREPPAAAPHPVLDALATIDPDALTPREALELLYELKRKLGQP